MNKHCAICKHWESLNPNADADVQIFEEGICKRYPPVLDITWHIFNGLFKEGSRDETKDYKFWSQPRVEGDNVCGEFNPA